MNDGTREGTYPTESDPFGITYDGTNVWTAIKSGGDRVLQFRESDGTLLGTFPVGVDALNLVLDGSRVWVTNPTGNSVTALRASDGHRLARFVADNYPNDIAFDGQGIWVTTNSSLIRANARYVGAQASYDVPAAEGITVAGESIWVANPLQSTVTKISRASQ